MRLLQQTGDGFRLTEDLQPGHIPPYAILSHTWGADEVTYQDLVEGRAKGKKGYYKILFCGNKASQDGLQYFWIDTCCIDKTNHSELAETIVSMFQWYLKAAICYAYLTDVDGDDGIDNKNNTEKKSLSWEDSFRKSRWFTRGWTLQELLAPASVNFYDTNGTILGNKRSLEKIIHGITGIPVTALRGRDLSDFAIEERVRWTEFRNTTREEDLAYCLFGIFGVYLPILYGEGKDNALRRLRREMQVVHGPAVAQQKKRTRFIAFERNPAYVERQAEMQQLHTLTANQQMTKIAIAGLGGTGKTQLALEFAFQHEERFPSCSTFWIPCISADTIEQAYRGAARQLELRESSDPQANVQKLLQDFWNSDESGQWLLVFDNMDDWSVWQEKRMASYLPRKAAGTILFTTRDNKVAVRLAAQNVIRPVQMEEDLERQLFGNCLIDKEQLGQNEDLQPLFDRLEHIPLALVQAAKSINMNMMTIEEYTELLDGPEQDVMELLSEDFEDDWRYQNEAVSNSLFATWQDSFSQIRKQQPLAADYLSFMSCMHHFGIPQTYLPKGPTLRAQGEAIGTLRAFFFVDKHSAGDQDLNMPPLVQMAVRHWLRTEKTLEPWINKVAVKLCGVLPVPDDENSAVWRQSAHHVEGLLKSAHNAEGLLNLSFSSDPKMLLLTLFAEFLGVQGMYERAISFLRTAPGGLKTPNKCMVLRAAALLVDALNHQCQWAEADEVYNEALQGWHPAGEINNWLELSLEDVRAETHWFQGRLATAELALLPTCRARARLIGVGGRLTLSSLANMYRVYAQQGRLKDAKLLCSVVLETGQRTLPANHMQILTSMGDLASINASLGLVDEAMDMCSRVVILLRKKVGEIHQATANYLDVLASIYQKQGQEEKARELHSKAMCTHSVLGRSGANGRPPVYRGLGPLAESNTGVQDLGSSHPETLIPHIAMTVKDHGRLDKACDFMRDYAAVQKREFGPGAETEKTLDIIRAWEAEAKQAIPQ